MSEKPKWEGSGKPMQTGTGLWDVLVPVMLILVAAGIIFMVGESLSIGTDCPPSEEQKGADKLTYCDGIEWDGLCMSEEEAIGLLILMTKHQGGN